MIKSDDRRETFDEHKLRAGFERALQKRPVSSEQVDAAVRAVVEELRRSGEREVPSMRIGELVMRELKKLDQVAYIRFASVYRSFQDVQEFREEIERLQRDLPAIEGLQLCRCKPRPRSRASNVPVVPAKVGTHLRPAAASKMDSGLRRNDDPT